MQNLKHSLKLAALPLFLAASTANAAGSTPDITNQTDLTTGIAEIILPNITPNDAGEGVRKAISQFGIPATLSYRPIANTTPARPGQPSTIQVEVLGTPARAYVCDGGFAELRKRPAATANAFIQVAEGTQVCLYNFKAGVKAYVVFNRIVRSQSLTAGLFKGITTAIQGKDEDRIAKELKWSIDEIKKVYPGALIQRISIPGKPVEEPDMEAVAKILPAEVPPAAAAMPAVATAVPATQVALVAQAPAGSVQAKVNARKDLNAMGLSYHSAEQFHQAISRKDDVAVGLFLAGGGVDPSTADASGVSALAVAERIGAHDILVMFKNHDAMKTPPAEPVVSAAAATPSAVPAQASSQSQPLPAIPAEIKAQIDQQIDAMPLTPEQKEAQRRAQYLNVQKILRSADSIKAVSTQ